MITLVHPGPGGLPALEGALHLLGYPCRIARTPGEAAPGGPLLLASEQPFDEGCAALKASGWWWELPQAAAGGRPLLGLGGGMHLLAEGSEASPRGSGLALLPGLARTLGPGRPLSGWCPVRQVREHPGIPDVRGAWLHFHMTHALETGALTLWAADHDRAFSVLEMRGRTLGLQARPEKSGAAGLAFLDKLLRALGAAPAPGPGAN